MTKKLSASSLPDFNSWQQTYYKHHPEEITLLHKEIIEEFNSSRDMPVEVLLAALNKVARLYGLTRLAKEANLNRESLYKALSPKGNPTVRTLNKMVNQLGYRLTLTPITHP